MQSNINLRTLAVLAMGALAGGREAMAWCPTATDRTISCSNCTVTLTCNVNGLAPIVITGYNVVFDGGWRLIDNSTSNAIHVASDVATIKNVHIYNPAGSGVYAISGAGDWLQLQYVYVYGGTGGLTHYYEGTLSAFNSTFENNQIGYYAGYGSPSTGGYADAYESSFMYNTSHGMYLSGKPGSYVHDTHSYNNDGHGVHLDYSPSSWVYQSYVYQNDVSGKNGLRLTNSSNSRIQNSHGWSNGSHDCLTSGSSGVIASGNSWTSSSGTCN